MRARTSQANPVLPPQAGIETEIHFTCEQIAALWGLDPKTIRRIFRDEPGVLLYGDADSRQSIRIPQSVMRAVHAQLTSRG
jgi:hypothetical protein